MSLLGAGLLSGASISLDNAGGDPDLTNPNFSFVTDQFGTFSAIYHNFSDAKQSYGSITLTAVFDSAFYNGPQGPLSVGASCDGKQAYTSCTITFLNSQSTLIFAFSGTDATHSGFPYEPDQNQPGISLSATRFEPFQTIGALAGTPLTGTPEPGAFALAGTGFLLAVLLVARKKLLKGDIRS